jgi:hypothetical protein
MGLSTRISHTQVAKDLYTDWMNGNLTDVKGVLAQNRPYPGQDESNWHLNDYDVVKVVALLCREWNMANPLLAMFSS